jgi:hypothetical protein
MKNDWNDTPSGPDFDISRRQMAFITEQRMMRVQFAGKTRSSIVYEPK